MSVELRISGMGIWSNTMHGISEDATPGWILPMRNWIRPEIQSALLANKNTFIIIWYKPTVIILLISFQNLKPVLMLHGGNSEYKPVTKQPTQVQYRSK